jgi:G3E family GTPase
MNGAARIFRTRDAKIELDSILDIGGFDLSRAQTVHPKFLEPEYPFEWSGVYELQQGPAEIVLGPGPDATMKVFLQPISGLAQPDVEVVLRDVTLRFSQDRANVSPGRTAEVGSLAQLELDPGGATYSVSIPNGGPYAVFTEHRGLDEYALRVRQSGTEVPLAYSHVYKPDHVHDTSVSSVGISDPRPVDPDRFNAWLRELVAASGKDIFRMKGVLNVKGHDRRWVFQGVHMLVTGSADREWGEGERRNTMIFIGRNLDREQLNAGFFSCIAEPA